MSDVIDRQAAIDAHYEYCNKHPDAGFPVWSLKILEDLPSAQPERLTDDDFETIRIHLNAYKEKLCNQHKWEEADEYQRIIDRFMAFASAQPVAKDINVPTKDCISRQAAIDAVYKCADIFAGDMPVMVVKADAYEALAQLPSAQPEKRTDKCTETHACDLISRQAVIEINRSYHGQMPNEVNHRIWEEINELPSAQPDMSEYSDKLWKAAYERGKAEAQAEIVRCKDCKHRTSYWGNCRLLEEKYHQSVLVDGDSFCSMAERRTDDCV